MFYKMFYKIGMHNKHFKHIIAMADLEADLALTTHVLNKRRFEHERCRSRKEVQKTRCLLVLPLKTACIVSLCSEQKPPESFE